MRAKTGVNKPKKRLFIAVNIPKALKEKIFHAFCRELATDGIKTTNSKNLHITIKFLGCVDEKFLGDLKKKISKIVFEKFEVNISKIGEFNGGVIWVGAENKEKKLGVIYSEICSLLGLQRERFHSHITIARNKSLEKIKVKKIASELNSKNFEERFWVKSIDLMESKLGIAQPVYEKVFQVNAK